MSRVHVQNRLGHSARSLAVAAMLALPAVAGAQTKWTGTTGSWFEPSNWTFGVPSTYYTAYIGNGGTAQITSGDAIAAHVLVGYIQGPGHLVQSGGTLSYAGVIQIGNYGGAGSYELSGNASVIGAAPAQEYVGYSADGSFLQTGGSNSVPNILYLGGTLGASGTYQLDAGSLSLGSGGNVFIGQIGGGHFIQNGGSVSGPPGQATIFIGGGIGGGLYELNGGTLDIASQAISPTGKMIQSGGQNTSSNGWADGTYIQTGGTNVSNFFTIGSSAGLGHYDLQGGTLTANYLTINGTCTVGGGTFNVTHLINNGVLDYAGAAAAAVSVANLTLNADGVMHFDIDPNSLLNTMTISGSAALDGEVQFNILSAATRGESLASLGSSDVITLLDAASPITGQFTNAPNSSRFSSGDLSFLVSYGAGSAFGADKLVLSDFQPAPEPASFIAGLGLLAMSFSRRHRSRK